MLILFLFLAQQQSLVVDTERFRQISFFCYLLLISPSTADGRKRFLLHRHST